MQVKARFSHHGFQARGGRTAAALAYNPYHGRAGAFFGWQRTPHRSTTLAAFYSCLRRFFATGFLGPVLAPSPGGGLYYVLLVMCVLLAAGV
ncbi:hypothetical protein B0H14DRAFT_2499058 [Mycena olivaceomarginata]|nr:hypothetical protein B0H14DRAFT_2499058 [Mycena olivaceomarginata]